MLAFYIIHSGPLVLTCESSVYALKFQKIKVSYDDVSEYSLLSIKSDSIRELSSAKKKNPRNYTFLFLGSPDLWKR